jgi:HEAT repeat protein
MSNKNMHDEKILQLKSEDAAIRTAAAESLMCESLTLDLVEALTALVEDQDKGVRNAVSLSLSYNGNEKIPHILVKYISSKDISVRNLAGEILLKIGAAAVQSLVGYIDKGNDDDKKFVIDILGLIGDSSAYSKIAQVMKENENENVILACVEALGNLAHSDSVEDLIEIYNQSELYKPMVVEAFGKIGCEEAREFIISRYRSEDVITQFAMIESLGLIGNMETFFFLLNELNSTEGALVWPLLESIYSLKEKFSFDVPYDERMKNLILLTIAEAEIKYKKAAAQLVSEFNDSDVVAACLNIYGEDAELDETLKPKFFENRNFLLSKLNGVINSVPKNLRHILSLIKEIYEDDPGQITSSISQIELRSLLNSFVNCLNNSDEEIRRTSAELLFLLEPSTALMFVDKMIEDDNLWNKLKLLELLESNPGEESLAALVKLSEDQEEMISERASMILAQFSAEYENKN